MIISASLANGIELDNSTNLYLTQNVSDLNNKTAFHCHKLRKKKLINSMWAYVSKVFMKIQDNGDKEETST